MTFAGVIAVIGAVTVAMSLRSPTTPSQDSGVSLTFLANEGVMLSAGGKKVLIDALFLKYERGYAVPADSTLAALGRARPPFDSVDVILVTHRHGDHFHPAPVTTHLSANRPATLVTSRQVIDSLRVHAPARALPAERLMSRTMRPGTRRREVISGIPIELLGLPHGGHPRVEHLGFIVELGGRRVLHVGDAELSEETLAPLRLDTARIDVALLPSWAIIGRKERRAIERWIRPRQVVAFHVGERDGAKTARAVRSAMPGAVTLVRSLETRRW
jgi:L-ascorbate metabolism protein UlaG (beta-lactamase superfamily)